MSSEDSETSHNVDDKSSLMFKRNREVGDYHPSSAARNVDFSTPIRKLITLILVIFLILAVLVYVIQDPIDQDSEITLLDLYEDPAMTITLKVALSDVLADDQQFSSRANSLSVIAKTADPMAYEILLRVASGEVGSKLAGEGRRLINVYLERQGLKKTSEQFSYWFSHYSLSNADTFSNFAKMLLIVNESVHIDQRLEALRELSKNKPELSNILAASLSLESSKSLAFTAALAEILREQGVEIPMEIKCRSALFAAQGLIARNYSKDISSFLSQCSDQEIRWMAPRVQNISNAMVLSIFDELKSRNILDALHIPFIDMYRDMVALRNSPIELKRVLLKGLYEDLTLSDLKIVKKWLLPSVDKVLLVVAYRNKNNRVSGHALGILIAKKPIKEPEKSIIQWAVKFIPKDWKKLSNHLAGICLVDIIDEEIVKESVSEIFDFSSTYAVASAFFDAIIKTQNSKLIVIATEIVGSKVSSVSLMKLMDFPEEEVRIAALNSFKRENSQDVIKELKNRHRLETNEEVLKVYDELWELLSQYVGEG